MARQTSIEFDQVVDACDAALAAGESISFANVYARMGRKGGAAVVQRLIAQYRSERGLGIDGAVRPYVAPEFFIDHIARPFIERCWKEAVAYNDEHHAEKYEAAAREHRVLEAKLEDSRSEKDAVSTLLTVVQADLNAACADRARLEQQIGQLQSSLADAGRVRDQFAARCSELQAGMEQLNKTLREELEKGACLLAKTKDEGAAQLAAERERSDGERRALMEQTDRLRQEAAAQVAELKRNLATREKLEAEHRVRAEKTAQELKEAQGRLREMEIALAASRDRADLAQGQVEALQAAASRSAAAIAAAESRATAMQERFEDERRRNEALSARIEDMREEVQALRAENVAEESGSADLEKKARSQGPQNRIKRQKV